MADMGGVNFFHVAMEAPNGDFELLEEAMKAANKEVDEAAEDRKGGGGAYGKVFFSAGDEELIMLAHVPESLKGQIDIKEWLQTICDSGIKGQIIGEVKDHTLRAAAKADRNNNLFPLKMRDTAIGAGIISIIEKKQTKRKEYNFLLINRFRFLAKEGFGRRC